MNDVEGEEEEEKEEEEEEEAIIKQFSVGIVFCDQLSITRYGR